MALTNGTQLNLTVDKDTKEAFAKACKERGESMASAITRLMLEYINTEPVDRVAILEQEVASLKKLLKD